MGLVSPEHAWILPSYYDPNWWRSPPNDTDDQECPNERILESVIFIDAVKLPPVVSIRLARSILSIIALVINLIIIYHRYCHEY